MKEVHLLDMLCRTDQRLNWSSHLGPLSGADPKMKEARAHHILTVFAYASNLGPTSWPVISEERLRWRDAGEAQSTYM